MIVRMAKKSTKRGVTNEKIMSLLVDMDERATNMDERVVDISKRMATKDDLENLKQEILEEIRPVSDAVDKDAKTVMEHGKRIIVLERRVGITTK